MPQLDEHAGLAMIAAEVRTTIHGEVIIGDQRGRTIGFATANVALPDDGLRPHDGVFAAYVHLPSGRVHPAAVSVGRRATFYGDDGILLAEAHLLDFDGDVYGQEITIELVGWLRGQVRFDGVAELRAQLAYDVERCADVLSALAPASRHPAVS